MVRRRQFNCYKVSTGEKMSGRPDGYNELNFKVAKFFEDASYEEMMIALIQPESVINVFRIVFTDGTEARKSDVCGEEAITMIRTVCALLGRNTPTQSSP